MPITPQEATRLREQRKQLDFERLLLSIDSMLAGPPTRILLDGPSTKERPGRRLWRVVVQAMEPEQLQAVRDLYEPIGWTVAYEVDSVPELLIWDTSC